MHYIYIYIYIKERRETPHLSLSLFFSLQLSLLFLSFSLLSSFLSLPSLLSSPALSPLLVSSLAFSFSISLSLATGIPSRASLFPPLLFLYPANSSLSRDGNNFRRERSFLSQFFSLPQNLSSLLSREEETPLFSLPDFSSLSFHFSSHLQNLPRHSPPSSLLATEIISVAKGVFLLSLFLSFRKFPLQRKFPLFSFLLSPALSLFSSPSPLFFLFIAREGEIASPSLVSLPSFFPLSSFSGNFRRDGSFRRKFLFLFLLLSFLSLPLFLPFFSFSSLFLLLFLAHACVRKGERETFSFLSPFLSREELSFPLHLLSLSCDPSLLTKTSFSSSSFFFSLPLSRVLSFSPPLSSSFLFL